MSNQVNNQQDLNKSIKIRQGLTQFVGALSENLEGDTQDIKQLITAGLAEEALKTATKEKGDIDFYVAKPILRAAVFILRNKINELNNLLPDVMEANLKQALESAIKQYSYAEDLVQHLIDSYKKEGAN